MKSIKKSTKGLMGGGIPMFIIGLITLIIGLANYGSENKRSTTVISGNSGSTVISTNIDWGNLVCIIMGILLLGIGVALVVCAIFFKKDHAEITEYGVNGFANNKNFTYPWEDIKEAKATNTSLVITTKNAAKPTPVFFISNAEEMAKEINKKILIK